jgi:hypothetical protein
MKRFRKRARFRNLFMWLSDQRFGVTAGDFPSGMLVAVQTGRICFEEPLCE